MGEGEEEREPRGENAQHWGREIEIPSSDEDQEGMHTRCQGGK